MSESGKMIDPAFTLHVRDEIDRKLRPTKDLVVATKDAVGNLDHRLGFVERDYHAKHDRTNGVLLVVKETAEGNRGTLRELVGGDAGNGIIGQLKDDVKSLTASTVELTGTVQKLAERVEAQAPTRKEAAVKYGAQGGAAGGVVAIVYLIVEALKPFF